MRIVAAAAVERIDGGVALDRVVEVVAGTVDAGGAGQRQLVDIGGERERSERCSPRSMPRRPLRCPVSPALSTK